MGTKRIENLIKSVNSRLQPLMEFDQFYAALYDPIRSRVEFPSVPQDGQPVEWVTRPYQPASWLLDSIIHTKSPRLVEQDFEQELEKDGLKYWPEGDLPQSWLAAPMIAEDRVIGVLVVESRRKPKAFGENGIRMLSTAARQAAVAIENARLVDQRDRKIASLSALYEMGQQLNTEIRSDERAILQLVYKQASQLMDTSNLYIALYDQTTDTVGFPLMFVDGQPTRVQSRSGGKGRTEWIIHNRKPILNQTRAESEAWYREPGHAEYIGESFVSWVGVPMMVGNKVLGVIATYHKTQGYVYTKDDQEILSLMANQAAVAIENARLYSNLEQRNEQLAALQEIGVEITSQLELDKLLDAIVAHTNALLSADFSTLFLYNHERGEFEKGIRKGKIEAEPSIPSNTGYSGRIAQDQRAVFVENVESELNVKPIFLENKKVKSFAGIPLVSRGKTVGILYVNYLDRHGFSKEEQNVIGLLANQAAVAIENATLYEHLAQANRNLSQLYSEEERYVAQLKLIQKIALDMSSTLDLREVLHTIAEGANLVSNADLTSIFPYDPEHGFEEGITIGISKITPTPPGKTGWAAQIMGKLTPLVVENVGQLPGPKREFLEQNGIQSFLGYPIQFTGRPIGLMFVNYVEPHAFTQSELEWMKYISNQAAIAIQNAKNFARVAEVERLQVASLMTADFAHRLGNYLGTIPAKLQVIEKDLLSAPGQCDSDKVTKELREITTEITVTRNELKTALEIPFEQKPQNVNLNTLLRSVVIRVTANSPDTIEFHESYEKDLPLLLCYPNVLFEAVRTIVENAVDAIRETGGRGDIFVQSKSIMCANGDVCIEASIRDTGRGIPESEMPHLFELFYTTKPKGVGYGLWRARNVIRQLGGDLLASSKLGEGTAMTISVPIERTRT